MQTHKILFPWDLLQEFIKRLNCNHPRDGQKNQSKKTRINTKINYETKSLCEYVVIINYK